MAGRHEVQIKHYAPVVDEAQDAIGEAISSHNLSSKHYRHISAEQMKQVVAASERQITTAEERITELRGEVRRVHEEIGKLIAKLSDTDLAFLEPQP
jgi:predicted RNase H-like nuclease (RuvC/YqgF family)